MDEKYFAKKIEQKWQKKWAESGAFNAEIDEERPKFYQLEMLPYPSGNLHMGHVRNYSAGDALAWYKRLRGFNVLHPIGWDSFGQPAEDAAVKRGVNPRTWTEENINVMRGQLQRLGISYDWRRQMYAHTPEYYKFDQWFFLKMYEMGLAYKRMTQVNWCSHDQATLSNEQASGGICWRCGNPVTKKDLEQWFLKTTAYTGQLLDDIAEIEAGWPQHVIKRQSDWIGRSEGAFVDFKVLSSGEALFYCETDDGLTDPTDIIRVFTTRIDTIYGANAIVVAAEHPVIQVHLELFSEEVNQKIAQIRVDNAKPADHEVEIDSISPQLLERPLAPGLGDARTRIGLRAILEPALGPDRHLHAGDCFHAGGHDVLLQRHQPPRVAAEHRVERDRDRRGNRGPSRVRRERRETVACRRRERAHVAA